eukprot:GGOE01018002.1.p1 GENE.GGOE01018002.1~~GGOE01018002.1.p1  ORF type:complete len:738 (-),score=114.68 GGOE01018002.1:300-2513(-)
MAHSMVAPRAGGELVPFTQWDIERRGIKAHYDLVSGGVQPSIPIPTHLHQCTSATRGHCGVAHRWPSLLEASWLRTTKSVPVPQDGALFLVAVLWACLASMVIQHRFRVTPASCQPVAMAAILGKQIDPKRDYYAELGVACTASAAEIKIAFRKMALEVHPDVSTQPESTAQFLKVNQAYQVLSKPLDRQTYDSLRKLSVSSYSPFRTSPTTVPPAPPQYQRYASPKPHAPYNVYHDFDDTYGINNSDMHHRHQRKPPPRAKAKPKPKPKPKAHARGLKDQPKRVWGGPGQRTSASHRPPGWADMGFLDEDEYDIDSSNTGEGSDFVQYIDDDLTDDDSVFEESYFNHHAKAGGGADMYSETDGFEFDNMDGPSAVSDGDSDGEAAEIEAGTRGLEISPQEVYNSASALMRAALASQLLAMLQAGGFQYNDAAPGNEHVMRRSVKLKCFLQVNTCIQDSGYTQKVHRHNPGIRVAAIYQPSEKPSAGGGAATEQGAEAAAATTALLHSEGSDRIELRTEERHMWRDLMAAFAEAELTYQWSVLEETEMEGRFVLGREQTTEWLSMRDTARMVMQLHGEDLPSSWEGGDLTAGRLHQNEEDMDGDEGLQASRAATKARRRSQSRGATEASLPITRRHLLKQHTKEDHHSWLTCEPTASSKSEEIETNTKPPTHATCVADGSQILDEREREQWQEEEEEEAEARHRLSARSGPSGRQSSGHTGDAAVECAGSSALAAPQ